jgi:rubrerythrin
MSAAGNHSRTADWVERIPYDTVDRARVRNDTVLFHMVSSASLVEFASDVYTRNLAKFFHDDDEVVDWLTQSWEKEELQHGEALRRYVQAAWPDLDWESAYEGFIAELVPCYSVDRLAPTRALEMVGRCLVESGTATFYRMMSALATEPVLKEVARKISADEVRHYKHFYRYYLRYREIEKPGRSAVLRMLWARSSEIDTEDVVYAVKHILRVHNPHVRWQRSEYEAVRNASLRLARRHYPYAMATKMLLKPLGLNAAISRVVAPAAASAARLLFLR